ncbi:hypothetical protein [Serratia ureilytica]|uniref:hypothetical protein n=1 Tax=Serratia ureilytica TaxID=300181 RepID=UPI001D18F029|nr:hypothetical protein [Serratia ureilytica]MCC4104747.1 hypothetical protein [Serratia ureilytica]
MLRGIRYYDDREKGLTRETSSPRFVSLASDDFYYSESDDFSPFGNDDGNDTLRALEIWYRGVEDDEGILDFLERHLSGWGLGVPWGRIGSDIKARESWLDEEKVREVYFRSECRAIIAAAFGQLKIAGHINVELLRRAMTAISDQLWMNTRARARYPNWSYAKQDKERLEQMLSVLSKISIV